MFRWLPATNGSDREETTTLHSLEAFLAEIERHKKILFKVAVRGRARQPRDALRRDLEIGLELPASVLRDPHRERAVWISPGGASRRLPPPAAALLPPWDEYLVAYKDRDHALGHLREVPPMVIGRPLLVIDGRVRGDWSRVPRRFRPTARSATGSPDVRWLPWT
jgi:hypothetical protein